MAMSTNTRPGALEREDTEWTLDLSGYVPFFVRAIANKLSRASTVRYNKEFGIGLGEWSCLALLALEPDIPATRIAEVSGFDKAAISRSLRILEDRGFVQTRGVANHNRKKLVRLTPEGNVLYRKIARIAAERENKLLEGLSEAERALLIRMLRAMDVNAAQIMATEGVRLESGVPNDVD